MRLGRLLIGTVYLVAGAGHFLATHVYMDIMPDYLPAHRELVLASGLAEMAAGVGVMLPVTRRVAAWGIIVLLIAVMPANLWMVQHPERYRSIPLWALWARLPLQIPLIWWARRYTRPDSRRVALA